MEEAAHVPPGIAEVMNDPLRLMVYMGPSMNPILKNLDQLEVVRCEVGSARRGDVILFTSPKDGKMVIHRVVGLEKAGLRTAGDNNDHIDSWLVGSEHIRGRVTQVLRGGKRARIHGGRMGLFVRSVARAVRRARLSVEPLLAGAYHGLGRSHLFGFGRFAQRRMRVIAFNRGQRTEMQLLMGRHVIGHYGGDNGTWKIRRPFRLFVDESTLPRGTSRDAG